MFVTRNATKYVERLYQLLNNSFLNICSSDGTNKKNEENLAF